MSFWFSPKFVATTKTRQCFNLRQFDVKVMITIRPPINLILHRCSLVLDKICLCQLNRHRTMTMKMMSKIINWNQLRENHANSSINLILFSSHPPLTTQNSDILNFGTGSVSWFESNGPGCKPIFPANATIDPFRPTRPERVDGCLLDYQLIEVIQSSVQSFLAVSITWLTLIKLYASPTQLIKDINFPIHFSFFSP